MSDSNETPLTANPRAAGNTRGQERFALLQACRENLARMTVGDDIPTKNVPKDVREVLLERGLIHIRSAEGYITPTHRARGYCHSPQDFEI